MIGVSLIQSNASGFGSHLVEHEHRHQSPQPRDRLQPLARTPGRVRTWPTSAAHVGPRARHQRSDLVVGVRHDGRRRPAADPAADRGPSLPPRPVAAAAAINAGRWVLRGPETGFDTWTGAGGPLCRSRDTHRAAGSTSLAARGHRTEVLRRGTPDSATPTRSSSAPTACSPVPPTRDGHRQLRGRVTAAPPATVTRSPAFGCEPRCAPPQPDF